MPKNYIKLEDKAGHKEIIGETIAKLILWRNGINVYSRFLDVDGIDFIIRLKKEGSDTVNYREIQLKYSKNYSETSGWFWFNIRKKTFRARKNYYFMFVCGDEKNIVVIPSLKLKEYFPKLRKFRNKSYVDIKIKEGHAYLMKGKKMVIDNLKEYYNNFERLKSNFLE